MLSQQKIKEALKWGEGFMIFILEFKGSYKKIEQE